MPGDRHHCHAHPSHAVPSSAGPPWELRVVIQRPEVSPYHMREGFRVRMLLDGTYPASPPKVHFMQVLRRDARLDGQRAVGAIEWRAE